MSGFSGDGTSCTEDSAGPTVAEEFAAGKEIDHDDSLSLMSSILAAYDIPASSSGGARKRRATVSSISDIVNQIADTGCWCPMLDDADYHGKGAAADDVDQACKNLVACNRRTVECGTCASVSDQSVFTVEYNVNDNTFSCATTENNSCDVEKCNCQMEWASTIMAQITAAGNQLITDDANLGVSDSCVAGSATANGTPFSC